MPVALPLIGIITLPAFIGKLAGIIGVVFALAAFKVALKLLALFGVGTLTISGFASFFDIIQDLLINSFDGLPGSMIAILFKSKVDVAITIILSAHVQGIAQRGIDSLTRPIMINSN